MTKKTKIFILALFVLCSLVISLSYADWGECAWNCNSFKCTCRDYVEGTNNTCCVICILGGQEASCCGDSYCPYEI